MNWQDYMPIIGFADLLPQKNGLPDPCDSAAGTSFDADPPSGDDRKAK